MANGNGKAQAKTLQAHQFGAPGGPDPRAAGKKGGLAREAAIQANIEKAREYAAAHLLAAVEVFVEALEAEWDENSKTNPQWFVRIQAAKEIVNRIMGQAPQKLEVTKIDAFTTRMDALLKEMDEREHAPA